MDQFFLKQLLKKHQQVDAVPSNAEIAGWAINLIRLIFPEQSNHFYKEENLLLAEFHHLKKTLKLIIDSTKACEHCNSETIVKDFFDFVPELHRLLQTDITATLNGDPAAKTEFEVIRTYPGFYTLAYYRIAHRLYKLEVNLIPRILTEYAHSKTGIDIHPAAEIGEYMYIDHGTGTVIGETCKIGNHVKLYQGVTLGALSVEKNMAGLKRHPTVEDEVIIYSGATILGGDTVIGKNSIIGGNVWLTYSIAENSIVYHTPDLRISERTEKLQS